mmetsp:Transcript_4954/g.10437  ORF Transcript_4954/g.10437 Transcript_4954/m.10437 type:complete len:250 (+) Transcript_4954:418-1167(+)
MDAWFGMRLMACLSSGTEPTGCPLSSTMASKGLMALVNPWESGCTLRTHRKSSKSKPMGLPLMNATVRGADDEEDDEEEGVGENDEGGGGEVAWEATAGVACAWGGGVAPRALTLLDTGTRDGAAPLEAPLEADAFFRVGLASTNSRIWVRRWMLGITALDSRASLVMGDVSWVVSQSSMALRSYVWPSMVTTGFVMRSQVMAQKKCSGISGGEPPTAGDAAAAAAAAGTTGCRRWRWEFARSHPVPIS